MPQLKTPVELGPETIKKLELRYDQLLHESQRIKILHMEAQIEERAIFATHMQQVNERAFLEELLKK